MGRTAPVEREACCKNCAESFNFRARGGVDRPLCPGCEKTYKWCPSCSYALVHEAFSSDPRNRTGFEGVCRQCKGRAFKARYEKTYKHNPRSSRATKLKALYGLTLDQWDQLVLAQGGRCAICDTATSKLVVDHCHQTLVVRGLLCPPCNKGLGHFGDDVDRMVSATAYLLQER